MGGWCAKRHSQERAREYGYLNVGVWYDKESGHIHLTLPHSGWFHTTVTNEAGSKRCHSNLFAKLSRALKEAGVPAPDVVEAD